MSRAIRTVVGGACLLAALTFTPRAGAPDVGRSASPPGPSYRAGQVVVQYKPSATAADREALRKALGATRVRRLGRTRVESVRISKLGVEQAIHRFRGHPGVEWIEPDFLYRIQLEPDDPQYPEQWGLSNVGQTGGLPDADISAPALWDQVTSAGDVVIAIIDTGVDHRHEDLRDNIFVNPGEIPENGIDDDGNGLVDDVHGWDFANDDNDPHDDNGHGTHVAGIAGAVGNNGIGTTGVAWQVRLLPLKFLDAEGFGTTSDAVAAIDYALAMGVKIINASWGGNNFSNILRQGVQRAQVEGALFVAAAGNSTPGRNNELSPFYPSSFDLDNIIAVAATDHEDRLAGFSHFGIVSVDLAAPGVDILSTRDGDRYGFLSGTSMATPHVSGALALYRSRFPEIGAAEAKALVLDNVDPVEGLADRVVTGGRLNAFRPLADPDDTPPAAVGDLRTLAPESARLDLEWTTTGDDGHAGTATRFDIRRSTTPLTDENFATANRVGNAPVPGPGGTTMRMRVAGLDAATTYYFALKVADEFGNTSPISNTATGTTLGPPRVSFAPTEVEADLFTGQSATRDLVITNDGAGEYLFQVVVRHLIDPPAATSTAATETWHSSNPEPDPARRVEVAALDSAGWSVAGLPGNFEVTDATAANGSRYALHGFDATSGHFTGLYQQLGRVRPSYAGLYVRSGSVSTADGYFVLREAGGAEAIFFFADNTGRLFVNGDVGGNNSISYEPHRWYHVEFKNIDFDSRTFDYHVDGAPVQSGVPFRHPFVSSVDRVDLYNFHGGSEAWWDEIQISTDEPPAPVSVDVPSGVLPAGEQRTVEVRFNASRLNGGRYHAEILFFGNDPLAPTIRIPATLDVTGAPDIEVATEIVDFGSLFVGGTTTAALTVANRGTDLLTVTGLAVDHADFDVASESFTLAPNQTRDVELSFGPSVLGRIDGTLIIESDDPDQSTWTVGLTGTGLLPPAIEVSPLVLTERLYTGQSSEQAIRIENTGFSNLDWEVAFPESGHPSLEAVRSQIDVSHGAITAWIPNLHAFLGGDGGVSIPDGGNDMYDTGNFISTNLQGLISYTTGNVRESPAFGPGGRYFTRKYPGLFVLAADLSGVGAFAITGNLGADGLGSVNGKRLFWHVNGIPHFGFLKRVFGAANPSVNHLIVVADAHPGITHEFSEHTNSDYHIVSGLSQTRRLYYLLYSSRDGGFVDDQTSLEIFLTFLRSLDYSQIQLDVAPIAGRLGPGESTETIVTFDAFGLVGREYSTMLEVLSNDPVRPVVPVSTTLIVDTAPDIAVTESLMDYGQGFVGANRLRGFDVRNVGSHPLIVFGIESDDPAFVVNPVGTFGVPRGESVPVAVAFVPPAAGQYEATLVLRSNDPDEQVIEVRVRGVALEPPHLSFVGPGLAVELDSGDTTVRTVTVGNVSGSDLLFSPSIVPNNPGPPAGQTDALAVAGSRQAPWVEPAPRFTVEPLPPDRDEGAPPAGEEPFLFRDDFEDGNLDGWQGGGFGSATDSPLAAAGSTASRGEDLAAGAAEPPATIAAPALVAAVTAGAPGATAEPGPAAVFPFRVDPTARRVPAGTAVDIEIVYDATGLTEGLYVADLLIESNDPEQPRLRRPLTLQVIGEPRLGSSRDELQFGVVHIGLPQTLPFTVTNFGSSTLAVTDIVSDDPEFTVNVTGFTLNPGESHSVNVTFTPTEPGLDQGTVTLFSNSPGEPFVVALFADARFPPKLELTGESLEAQLFTGQSATRNLVIHNDGGEALQFAASVVTAAGATPPHQLVVLLDDIEIGPGGWTNEVYAGSDLWHRTAVQSRSPVTSWGCVNPTGGYDTSQVVSTGLVSPPIDLRGVQAPVTLWFFERYDTEPVWDQCLVDVSGDGGATWSPLRGAYGQGPSGSTNGWVLRRLPLSAYVGQIVRVRFYFETGDHANNHFPGWFVDDVAVTAVGTPWLTVAPPEGVLGPGEVGEVAVRLDASAPRPSGDYAATVRIVANDPFRPQTELAATLEVRDPPRITFRGAPRVRQSSADPASGRSSLVLEVPAPPAGPGLLEVTATGDYGGVGKTVTVSAEALVFGRAGEGAEACATATRSFSLTPNQLAELSADGEVWVELRDSPGVGSDCGPHTHAVTLSYPASLAALELGTVPTRGTVTRTLTIANNGGTPLELTDVRADAETVVVRSAPASIPPHGGIDVEVEWKPTAPGPLTATLSVTSSDPFRPVASLPIHGEALPAPLVELAGEPLVAALPPFGTVVRVRPVALANAGEADLHFEAAPHPFATVDPPAGVLGPGEALTLQVRLRSDQLAEGEYADPVVLLSDDPGAPSSQVPLTLRVGEIVPDRFVLDYSPRFATVPATVEVAVQLPSGFAPDEIVPESLTLAGGAAALPGQVAYHDLDLDGVTELIVQFDLEAFIESLPRDAHASTPVILTGEVRDRTWFRGTTRRGTIPLDP